jgi:hypothetical protein
MVLVTFAKTKVTRPPGRNLNLQQPDSMAVLDSRRSALIVELQKYLEVSCRDSVYAH